MRGPYALPPPCTNPVAASLRAPSAPLASLVPGRVPPAGTTRPLTTGLRPLRTISAAAAATTACILLLCELLSVSSLLHVCDDTVTRYVQSLCAVASGLCVRTEVSMTCCVIPFPTTTTDSSFLPTFAVSAATRTHESASLSHTHPSSRFICRAVASS